MTYAELVDFLQHKMSMSHVYQPVLIKALIESGGSATVRQLAQRFLAEDESQILYYEKRIKEMPVRVLRKHGIISVEGGLVSLRTPQLSLQQRSHVRMLCEQRLQTFVQKRGLAIWDYRMLEDDPIPDSLRYLALKAAGGRCQLCGITAKERPLDVDHIIPRARGGRNELANLQVLCAKCNRSKRDRDSTDFRSWPLPDSDPQCYFCKPEMATDAFMDNGSAFAVQDRHPVTAGHTLVLPKRHVPDWFDMTATERQHVDELIRVIRGRLMSEHKEITGFNVGTDCGQDAGQIVMHAHIHVIPRRNGDVPDPCGGVSGVRGILHSQSMPGGAPIS
jgi:diadenosine tetraphosphate (Ap4A) HIT family hydrolase/5-methylcytosine-specific restriction endonuclease McrA